MANKTLHLYTMTTFYSWQRSNAGRHNSDKPTEMGKHHRRSISVNFLNGIFLFLTQFYVIVYERTNLCLHSFSAKPVKSFSC
jgi:hypothetical protein